MRGQLVVQAFKLEISLGIGNPFLQTPVCIDYKLSHDGVSLYEVHVSLLQRRALKRVGG